MIIFSNEGKVPRETMKDLRNKISYLQATINGLKANPFQEILDRLDDLETKIDDVDARFDDIHISA